MQGSDISFTTTCWVEDAIPLVFDAWDCRLLLPMASYLGLLVLLVLSLSVPW